MSRGIRVSSAALADVTKIMLWYEDKAGLGREFLEAYERCVEDVAKRPESFAVRDFESSHELRFAALERFPYWVVFALTNRETLVLAVIHNARDVGTILRRRAW